MRGGFRISNPSEGVIAGPFLVLIGIGGILMDRYAWAQTAEFVEDSCRANVRLWRLSRRPRFDSAGNVRFIIR
jgi:hypothetical protein